MSLTGRCTSVKLKQNKFLPQFSVFENWLSAGLDQLWASSTSCCRTGPDRPGATAASQPVPSCCRWTVPLHIKAVLLHRLTRQLRKTRPFWVQRTEPDPAGLHQPGQLYQSGVQTDSRAFKSNMCSADELHSFSLFPHHLVVTLTFCIPRWPPEAGATLTLRWFDGSRWQRPSELFIIHLCFLLF